MTTEQWQRAEDLFERGLQLSQEAREALISAEFSDNAEVVQHVHLLWRSIQDAGSFLETPVAELPQTEQMNRQMLERGRVIGGRFTVLELLGAGGMGEVYRARDERLGRIVALKVLPQRLGDRPEYRVRLEREARAVSSLTHPRICALHDVGTDGDLVYLVMEFLAGEPLSGRLALGPLPLQDVLRIGTQMADGLEHAHNAGIVHRDLKPANIMLTDSGVKLLDFGVAKRTAAALDGNQSTITAEGQIIGTVAYMSPEQAEGKTVDARSDIFSLGSILYQMATGRRPFQGDSSLSTLAAILREQPAPIRQLIPTSPPQLDALIRQCLEKRPDKRPSTAAQVRERLQDLQQLVSSKNTRWRAAVAAGSVAVFLSIASLAWTYSRQTPQPYTANPVRVTVEGGNARYPAFSADGKLLAYASDRKGNFDIYVRQIGTGSELQLTDSPANEVAPTFTPDGQFVVFQSDQGAAGLQVVPVLGGEARVLAANGFRPRVSPDGSLVLFWTGPHGDAIVGPGCGIAIVPLTGGAPRQLYSDFLSAGHPIWLEDGKRVLFMAHRNLHDKNIDWWVGNLDGAPAVSVGWETAVKQLGNIRRNFVPVFARGGEVYGLTQIDDTYALVAVRFNGGQANGSVTAARVFSSLDILRDASVSAGGSVAFASIKENDDLYRLRLDPDTHKAVGGLERLTTEQSMDWKGSLSSDGNTLAFLSNRSGSNAVWVRDLRTKRDRRIAAVASRIISFMKMSPDGKQVAFTREYPGPVFVAPTGGGEPAPIGPDRSIPRGWKTSEILCLRRVNPTQDKRQYVDVSLTSKQIVWESEWMNERTPCSTGLRLQWCYKYSSPETPFITVSARPAHSPGSPQHIVARLSVRRPSGMITFPDDTEDVLYWDEHRNGRDVLMAQNVDPATGAPKGEPFVAYEFPGPARIANVNFQNGDVRNGAIVLTLRETTSNIWLQQLPE